MADNSPAIQEYVQRAGIPPQGESAPDTRVPNPVSQPIPPSEVGTAGVPNAPKEEFTALTQDDLIIQTLTEQLNRNNKLEKEKMKMAQPDPAPTTPSSPPSGGGTHTMPDGSQMAGASHSPLQQQGNYPL